MIVKKVSRQQIKDDRKALKAGVEAYGLQELAKDLPCSTSYISGAINNHLVMSYSMYIKMLKLLKLEELEQVS